MQQNSREKGWFRVVPGEVAGEGIGRVEARGGSVVGPSVGTGQKLSATRCHMQLLSRAVANASDSEQDRHVIECWVRSSVFYNTGRVGVRVVRVVEWQ